MIDRRVFIFWHRDIEHPSCCFPIDQEDIAQCIDEGYVEYTPRADSERVCVWTPFLTHYETGCDGRFVPAPADLDRPCWCGGRVEVQGD